jgi:hypothetical protein
MAFLSKIEQYLKNSPFLSPRIWAYFALKGAGKIGSVTIYIVTQKLEIGENRAFADFME